MAKKYDQIIEHVFKTNFNKGDVRVGFDREELANASEVLGFPRIKNLGDIPYSYRFRNELPGYLRKAAPANSEWIILGAGVGKYEFRLASPGKIAPSTNFVFTKVPDATPEIVRFYAPGTDEQALLTKVRYNRLIDLFTGLTCHSIQNHLRTTVPDVGQIEVDEIYLGINRKGVHFSLPCQAKSPGDMFGIAQIIQDKMLCDTRYPNTVCKPLALQFLGEDDLAMLELAVIEEDDILKLQIVDEKHFSLVPRSDIDEDELLKLKKELC